MNEFDYYYNEYSMYCSSKGLAKKTLKSYEQTLYLFFRYCREQLSIDTPTKVDTKNFRQYINYLQERGKYTVLSSLEPNNNPEGRRDYKTKISNATINNYIRNVKVFYTWLAEEEELGRNPLAKIKYLNAPRKPKETISEDTFKNLLKGFDLSKFNEYRNFIITELLIDSGMRVGECLALKVDNINFFHSTILIQDEIKGDKPRYVYFGDAVKKDLKKWLNYKDRYAESDLVFVTNRNTRFQIQSFEKQLKNTSNRIGVVINPHQLRNNFAKNYLLNGGDLHTLAKILGHSSVKVTEKAYLDLTNQEIRQQYKKFSPLNNYGMK